MKHLKSILTLFAICAIVSLALAVCYEITAPIILERQQAAASGALLEVMPDGGTFEKVDISSYELPATIKEANKASNGGYVFQVEFAGFNPGNIAMIGVSADGKVTGTKMITNTESSGFGADHLPALDSKNHYKDADASTIDTVDTVGGGTMMAAELMTQIDVYVRAKIDQIQEYSNIHLLAFGAKLDAMKECLNQDRNVLYVALRKSDVPFKEKK